MNDSQSAAAVDLDPLDRIEKSVDIDASPEKVFALVSRPGWWINDGSAVDPEPEVRHDGDVTVVTHPEYGEFRLQTEASEPPTYVAIRWHHRLPDDGVKRCTLVEFRIAPREGGVTLSVVESGFSGLHKPREEWLQDRANNDAGWDAELALARTFIEAR